MKKSRKILVFVLVFVIAVTGIIVHANRKPPHPVTNLEFWIGDKVDGTTFSGYQQKGIMFGGSEYYGTGYVPTMDGNREIDPEHCVIYTVTAFPDHSSGQSAVTSIYITDPSVEFYGISLNSSHKEFDKLMKKQGFQITDTSAIPRTARRGKYTVTFTKEYIRISVKVSNLLGVQF